MTPFEEFVCAKLTQRGALPDDAKRVLRWLTPRAGRGKVRVAGGWPALAQEVGMTPSGLQSLANYGYRIDWEFGIHSGYAFWMVESLGPSITQSGEDELLITMSRAFAGECGE